MAVISVIVSAFVFPFVGTICDLYSPRITIPVAFFSRAVTTFFFQTVKEPNSKHALVAAILMIIATIVENISVDTIFAQNLPKETRAILNGVYSFFGQVGILIFSLIAGWLFDNVGPKSPFVLIGILDLLYALLVIVFALCGLFDKHD